MNVTIYQRIANTLTPDAKNALYFITKENCGKLKNFKNFIKTIEIEKNGNDKSLQDLITIYFLLESKNPAKSLIQTFFNQMISNKEKAVIIFANLLRDQVIEFQQEKFELVYSFKVVDYLNELSQNFEIAFMAVGYISDTILSYLNAVIKFLLKQLSLDLSPSKKSEASRNLHNSFQAYIFCIKSCLQHENTSSEFITQFDELMEICDGFFENNDISMETKNIFSMLMVISNNFKSQMNHLEMIDDEKESPEKRLCLIFGVIQVTNCECLDEIKAFCNILHSIYNNNSVNNGVVYAVARLLSQIIKKMLAFQNLKHSEQFTQITTSILSIALLNLEHSIESVRYFSKETIKTLIEIESKMHDGECLINDFFQKTSSLPIEQKAAVVSAIQSVISVEKILQKFPDLLFSIISTLNNNKEGKINCYVNLTIKGRNELPFQDWYEIFIHTLEDKIQNEEILQDYNMLLKNLILKCIRKDREAIESILEHRNLFDKKFNFMLLNLAKDEGLLEDNSKSEILWKGTVSYHEIKNAMIDIDIDLKLSALNLIVDTKKITDELSQKEIECIFHFFENNININIPSTRQILVRNIKRIFARIRCTIQSCARKNDKCFTKNQFVILLRFHNFATKNLIIGANYPRRHFSLVILLCVHEIIDEYFPCDKKEIWDKKNFDALFSVFNDGYEQNKEKALEIIAYIPNETIKNYSNVTFDHLEKMHKSIKPADSQTASYLLLLAMKFPIITTEDQINSYKLMIWSEIQLMVALERAEKSIIVAAGSNPVYGWISSMRLLISKLNFNDIVDSEEWRDYFERLVKITRRLTNVAAPIVNDQSPEGIFPTEDFHQLLQNETEKDIRNIIENTTPQMILLCAWRIIKEVSLLLGDISQKAVEISNSKKDLINYNQLIEIGDHFLELLSSIKHRGAFEQCYAGFSQYCFALRISNYQELHSLPLAILQNILDSISKNFNDSLDLNTLKRKTFCATRRSAGLPFIIQGLLSSEAKISRYDDFHFAIKSLLNFAQYGKKIEVRIHSLNILRVLYRCKELNDVINQYISEGIQCSILGCGSETWAERNSSTLLFSALMIRTFGVQRNKDSDQIDIRNKISAKIFFLHYPELYDFFIQQFTQCVEFAVRQQINPMLYSLLLILNRLFTTPAENCESNTRLINFVPIVSSCSGCVELRARVLCAKFVANVAPFNAILSMISCSLQFMKENKNLNSNSKHGYLLQILYLSKKIAISHSENNLKQIIEILDELLNLAKELRSSIICFSTILDAIIQIFHIIWYQDYRDLINQQKIKNCFDFDKTSYYGIQAMQSSLSIIELILIHLGESFNINDFFQSSMNFCELLQKLNCIILFLNDDDAQRKMIIDDYEIDPRIHFYIENFSDPMKTKFLNEIRKNNEFVHQIVNLTKHHDLIIQARSYEILSLIDYIVETHDELEINELLRNALKKADDYKTAILKYTSSWMRKNNEYINLIDWKTIAEFIDSSYLVKFAIVDMLSSSGKYLTNLTLEAFFHHTTIVINLLRCEDFDVSKATASAVCKIIEMDQSYTSSCSVKYYFEFLMKTCKFQQHDKILVLILLLFDKETTDDECNEDEFNEFQVFEKVESNNTIEMFIVKDIIMSILKFELINCSVSYSVADFDQRLLNFCKEIGKPVDSIELSKFLERINVFN